MQQSAKSDRWSRGHVVTGREVDAGDGAADPGKAAVTARLDDGSRSSRVFRADQANPQLTLVTVRQFYSP